MIYKIASLLEMLKLISGYLVIVLALAFVFLFKHFPKIKVLSWLIKSFSVLLILIGLVLSFLNGYLWKHDAVSYRLLPPYSPFSYVFHYSWQHYFAVPVITIFFALIVFWGIKWLNKKFQETFFYDEEPYLAALGILATGWPNCLIFLCLVLLLGVTAHFIIQKGRLPLLYFWLPCALLVLLLSGIISKYITINQLVI
jgi:hypothetical protein